MIGRIGNTLDVLFWSLWVFLNLSYSGPLCLGKKSAAMPALAGIEGRDATLRSNVGTSIPLCKGLQGATSRSDTCVVHAPGWTLYARIPSSEKTIFIN